ncbi:hypothetical protein APED_27175 [Acanthopleuribacter pedis]
MNLDPTQVGESFDLIDSGLVDSMDFLNLIDRIEQEFELSIDFCDLDPSSLTQLGRLLDLIENAGAKSALV